MSARCLGLWLGFFLNPLLLEGSGVKVVFDPASAEIGPFPSDFLTVSDPAQKTGLRVDLPSPDCSREPSSCEELALINELDGFNLQPRVRVRFSGRVDVDTLRQGVFFIWLDSLTSEEVGPPPAGHQTRINQVIYDPTTNTAYAESDEVLNQQRRYLLVVTEAVRDPAGDPVEPDQAFLDCVSEPGQSGYCLQLAGALSSGNLSDRVVAASIFTTLSATAWMESAHRLLQASPTNFQRTGPKNVFSIASLSAITWRMQVGVNPVEFSDFTVPLPSVLLPGVGRIAFGSFQSPQFLDDQGQIPTVPTGAEVTFAGTSQEIFFHAFLPFSSMPPSGFPVVIFGHGISDSRFGGPTLVASAFAEARMATVAIHAVGHGQGPESRILLRDLIGRATDLPAPGRGADFDGDGVIGSREGCLVLAPFAFGLRDCVRQTALDLMQLVRTIREGVDLDGDGQVDLDPERIYYAGQSLGAIYGTVFNAIEPNIQAAVLNAGGGSVVELARWSPSFRSLVRDVLAARTPPLLDPAQDLNENYVLRDQPVKINQVTGAIEIQNVLERYEWLQAPGDPLSYASHLQSSRVPGIDSKPVLWQFARGDQTVPNPANSNLIRAAGMREMSSLYRHDLARAVAPGLPENPHTFLLDIRSPAGLDIASAAQRQMAGFVASGGGDVPNVNALLGLLFRDALFVTPDRLPEDLGFAAPLTAVSAASFSGPVVAAESIVTVFGQSLAATQERARSLPLPSEVGGTTVRVRDSAGTERLAPLFFVSPGQVNCLIPAGTAPGTATVSVTSADNLMSTGRIQVESAAPGIFSANANGQGVAAALAVTVSAGGSQDFRAVFSDAPAGSRVPAPIELGAETDSVFLVLFGTGIRGRSGLSAVRARLGGEDVDVLFAGPQDEFAGLDQVNLGPLPRSLAGRGEAAIELIVDGKQANTVTVSLR